MRSFRKRSCAPRAAALVAAGIWAAALAPAARGATLEQVAAIVGAESFYEIGYTGGRAIIGNVEAGMVWDGHQVLDDGEVRHFVRFEPDTTFTYDSHATRVGGTMVADAAMDAGPSPTGAGIARGATVWSAQIATSFGTAGSFSITGDSLLYPLMVCGETGINDAGVIGGAGSVTVDVINSSWGGGNDSGNSVINVIYDYLANARGVTAVAAAGNSGQGAGTVLAPANSWNVIAVGATNTDTTSESVTSFSSGGPTGSFNLAGTRTKPDIVAPGLSITMPTTGTPTAFQTSSGTSFAAPVVAAGAALMIDYGKDAARSTDPRLVKAVLLSAAQKLTGWEQMVGVHPTTGTRVNYTPLDDSQGAGRMDLARTYGLYAGTSAGGTGAGAVRVSGWDVNTVADGAPRDYLIDHPAVAGSRLTATLVWFMDRTVDGFDPDSSSPYADADFSNDSFDDLDLLLYLADAAGMPTGDPVAASISNWDPDDPDAPAEGLDSVEHLYLTLPETGRYVLQVRWTDELFDFVADADAEDYALAWSLTGEVPGDANLDGAVDIFDLGLLGNSWAGREKIWTDGDFNGDGVVDVFDLAHLANHYAPGSAAGEPVPEPVAATLLLLGAASLGARRRTRRR